MDWWVVVYTGVFKSLHNILLINYHHSPNQPIFLHASVVQHSNIQIEAILQDCAEMKNIILFVSTFFWCKIIIKIIIMYVCMKENTVFWNHGSIFLGQNPSNCQTVISLDVMLNIEALYLLVIKCEMSIWETGACFLHLMPCCIQLKKVKGQPQ